MRKKPVKRALPLLLTLVFIASLLITGSAGALASSDTSLSESITYGIKTETEYGNYTYVNVTGLTPFVFMPTGAGSSASSDFLNVTDMMNTYGEANNIVVAINAGIFYNAGTPTQYCYNYKEADGVVISGGVVLKSTESMDHSECDILVIDESGDVGWTDYFADADALASGEGYYYNIHGEKIEGVKIESAVTGFVPILIDGVPVYDADNKELNGYNNFVGHYSQKAVRQIFGVKSDGSYGILTNSAVWTLADAAEAASAEGFVFAYNLDGGGSAETVVASSSDGEYTVDTLVSQSRGKRQIPTYIVFTADNEAPVSAKADHISAALSKDSFDTGISLSELVEYLTVTETFTNANGKTSERALYSRQGLDMSRNLEHTVVGGATALANCSVKLNSVSPNGTLVYTKTDKDITTCLISNSNTRQNGKYYDYSTGYSLSTDDDLNAPGKKLITVSYTPGSGLDALTSRVEITLAESGAIYGEASGNVKLPFTDISEGDWFYPYVADMYMSSLMVGVSENQFKPDGDMTRSMAVTVLYRLAGEPECEPASPYIDIAGGWYENAVIWAYSEGIIAEDEGTASLFKPDSVISSDQLMVLLHGYLEYSGPDGKYPALSLEAISADTEQSMPEPDESLSRAGFAAIMGRFLDFLEQNP